MGTIRTSTSWGSRRKREPIQRKDAVPWVSLHQCHRSKRLRWTPRLHRRHVRCWDILRRTLFEKQPIRIRDLWRDWVSCAQRPLMLYMSQVCIFFPGNLPLLPKFYFIFGVNFCRHLILCRVTLGKSFLQFSAMKMAHAPPGHHSVAGRPSAGGLNFPEYVVYRGEQVSFQAESIFLCNDAIFFLICILHQTEFKTTCKNKRFAIQNLH